jgi:very-short-patch-repair endonuclease/predicted transcriptional regulator of viral defense system
VLNRDAAGATIRHMPREWRIPPDIQTEFATRGPDAAIAALAERQHGVVSLPQLTEFGLLPSAVRERVGTGRLHRIHRGVYAVGYPSLTARGLWMAAVLACGSGAVLSHRSAAVLWGLREGGGSRIDVTAMRRTGRTRAGIRVHWRPSLATMDVTSCAGIPCTSVALTLLDLASVLSARSLEKACDRAEQLRIFNGRAIEELLTRVPGTRGTKRLRDVLSELDPQGAETRTEIERLMLALCRNHTLPQPVVNGWIQLNEIGFSPDFLWPEAKLIVETDSHKTHRTRRAFEADRRRDQLLAEAGYTTLRFTWRQITEEPERVARTIAAVLKRSVSPTSLRGNSALERRSPKWTISA